MFFFSPSAYVAETRGCQFVKSNCQSSAPWYSTAGSSSGKDVLERPARKVLGLLMVVADSHLDREIARRERVAERPAPDLVLEDRPDAAGEQRGIGRGVGVFRAHVLSAGPARGRVRDLLAVVEAELQLVVDVAGVEELGDLAVGLLLRILRPVVPVVVLVLGVDPIGVPRLVPIAGDLEGELLQSSDPLPRSVYTGF